MRRVAAIVLALAGCATEPVPDVFQARAHEGGYEEYHVLDANVRFEQPPATEPHLICRYWVQSDETGYIEGQPSEGPDPPKAPEEVSEPTYWMPYR